MIARRIVFLFCACWFSWGFFGEGVGAEDYVITPSFNYTAQGVIFSSPVTIPRIAGNDESGFELDVDSYPNMDLNWIIADLVAPARAVAVTSVSYTNLALYDAMGELIDQGQVNGSGGNILFLGAVSDVPFELVTTGRNSTHHLIADFYYSPVPEPAALSLLTACLAASGAARRKKQQGEMHTMVNSRPILKARHPISHRSFRRSIQTASV